MTRREVCDRWLRGRFVTERGRFQLIRTLFLKGLRHGLTTGAFERELEQAVGRAREGRQLPDPARLHREGLLERHVREDGESVYWLSEQGLEALERFADES